MVEVLHCHHYLGRKRQQSTPFFYRKNEKFYFILFYFIEVFAHQFISLLSIFSSPTKSSSKAKSKEYVSDEDNDSENEPLKKSIKKVILFLRFIIPLDLS